MHERCRTRRCGSTSDSNFNDIVINQLIIIMKTTTTTTIITIIIIQRDKLHPLLSRRHPRSESAHKVVQVGIGKFAFEGPTEGLKVFMGHHICREGDALGVTTNVIATIVVVMMTTMTMAKLVMMMVMMMIVVM